MCLGKLLSEPEIPHLKRRDVTTLYYGGGGLVTKLCPTLETSWTIARQAPLFMEFSRQEPWSGLPFAFPEDPS